jgi:Xaa-Pro aminopeptidase
MIDRPDTLPISFHQQKCAEIQSRLPALGLDGILLLDAYNVRYASGFVHIPSERPLGLFIPAKGNPAFFVPRLEQDHISESWVTDIRTYFEFPGEENPIIWMAREAKAKRLGIDSLDQPTYVALWAAGYEVQVTSFIEQMRWIKTPAELDLVRRAASYADFCLDQLVLQASDIIHGGGTELDLLGAILGATSAKMQAELGDTFELHGGSVVGTVHSGPRAALPHGRPGKRQPRPGEALIAGIGATVGGYHAESGATFILGEPTADQEHCLMAAAACNDAGVTALIVGTRCMNVNEAALAELERANLGPYIRHRIGHGMGLQGHESPWLAPGDPTVLQPGMVFSNEPGIYRPGIDGYRTINTMIVTNGQAEVPSRFLALHPPDKRTIAL